MAIHNLVSLTGKTVSFKEKHGITKLILTHGLGTMTMSAWSNVGLANHKTG